MDAQLKIVKQTKVLEALRLISDEGMTKVDACKTVGISTWMLSKYLADDPDLTAPLIQQRNTMLREDYEKVQTVHRTLLHKLLDQALAADLSSRDVMALELRLAQIEDRLSLQLGEKSGPAPEADNMAKEYLKRITGPMLRPGIAVITQREQVITVKIGTEQPQEIIEAKAVEIA